MEYQETKPSLLLELDSWQNLIHSEDWRAFLKLLKAHQEYLQAQVNSCLEKHEDRKAGEELAKLNDCRKMVALIEGRIKQLRVEIEK